MNTDLNVLPTSSLMVFKTSVTRLAEMLPLSPWTAVRIWTKLGKFWTSISERCLCKKSSTLKGPFMSSARHFSMSCSCSVQPVRGSVRLSAWYHVIFYEVRLSARLEQLEQTVRFPSSTHYGPSVRYIHHRERQAPELGDAFERKYRRSSRWKLGPCECGGKG